LQIKQLRRSSQLADGCDSQPMVNEAILILA
jgi:hypothetical protein